MTMYRYITIFVVLLSFLFSNTVQGQSTNETNIEESQVKEVANNLFLSYSTGDREQYLKSVFEPQSVQQQENLKYLRASDKQYKIDSLRKINNSTYTAYVSSSENGIDFPVVPYKIVKIDNNWKVDNLGYSFVPTINNLTSENSALLVAENENYKVYKVVVNYSDKPAQTSDVSTNAISIQSLFGPYRINNESPAIYMNGPYHVTTTVSNYQKFLNDYLIVEVWEHRAEGKRQSNIGGATQVTSSPGYFSMMTLYGYYSFFVHQEAADMVKPPLGESLSGTFTVDNAKR